MGKAFALMSYAVNAVLMLCIALLLAGNLSAAEYARYSFGAAITQTLVVCLFEWLRLAAARHYPGPNPSDRPKLRDAFLGAQYFLGFCVVALGLILASITADFYWLLIGCYAGSWGVLDLELTMLRFDSQLPLFSKLLMFRGFVSLLLSVSAAILFKHGGGALLGVIVANILTIAVLEIIRPGFAFISPSLKNVVKLRQVASYGISAATAGCLYQSGPFLLRCVAFRGESDTSYAAFSLVMDLMQRPYNFILGASNGAFFPDVVREHDQSPSSDNSSLRQLYAIDAWCLLMIFGGMMAFRSELMPLLVKPELLPQVLQLLPVISAFFLVHAAIQSTCALPFHLSRSGLHLMAQAACELGSIVIMTGLWATYFGLGIFSVSCGGTMGAVLGFLFASSVRSTVPCQRPWVSLTAAFLTSSLLVLIGQCEFVDRFAGIVLKALVVCPIILIGGFFGFAIPFGFAMRLKEIVGRVRQKRHS